MDMAIEYTFYYKSCPMSTAVGYLNDDNDLDIAVAQYGLCYVDALVLDFLQ